MTVDDNMPLQMKIFRLCTVLLVPGTLLMLALLFIGVHPQSVLDAPIIVTAVVAFLPVVVLNIFAFTDFSRRFRNYVLWMLRFVYTGYLTYVLFVTVLVFETMNRFVAWLPLALLLMLFLVGYIVYSLYSLYDTRRSRLPL